MKAPDKELIGINAGILKNGFYSDDYIRALNRFIKVEEVFGEYIDKIAAGEKIVAHLVVGTIGDPDCERHLSSLVMAAANAGRWKAVGREEGKTMSGLDEVVNREEGPYGYLVHHEDRMFLLPSLYFVEYCKERMQCIPEDFKIKL